MDKIDKIDKIDYKYIIFYLNNIYILYVIIKKTIKFKKYYTIW